MPRSSPRVAAAAARAGITVVPHGVSLGLGGADRPDEARLTALAERAEALGSPLVTEHIAFVRAGGPLTASPLLEAGHLLPVPRTRDALHVLCENVRAAQAALPVPLAVENIAALISWPGEEMTEGQFLYDLVDRTGVRLLIDVANLHTNHVNRGEDPAEALDELPVEAIAYVHVAGGFERDGVWHDSHAHPVTRPVLDILADLASRVTPPGVLLERDENFPDPAGLERELTAIRGTLETAKAATRGTPGARETREMRETTKAAARAAERGAVALAGCRAASPAAAGEAGAETEPTRSPGTSSPPPAITTPASRTPGDTEAAPDGPDGAGGPDEQAAPGSHAYTDDARRQRVALAQAALLSSLVAGTPAPEGFDRVRLGVQARALAAKRADVVAKVAPELPHDPGRRLPVGVPRVRAAASDDRRLPPGRPGLRRAPAAHGTPGRRGHAAAARLVAGTIGSGPAVRAARGPAGPGHPPGAAPALSGRAGRVPARHTAARHRPRRAAWPGHPTHLTRGVCPE